MADIDILMPALSPTMEEGTLVRWLVTKGGTVMAGEVIAEIETDKATMEVEAADDGILAEILVPGGSEGVKVNTPIARLSEGGGDRPMAQPAPEQVVQALSSAPADVAVAKRDAPVDVRPVCAPSPPPAADGTVEPKVQAATAANATPLARRLAEQGGIDLSTLSGSGPGGLIVKNDVAPRSPGRPAVAAPAPLPAPPSSPAPEPRALEALGIPPASYVLNPRDDDWRAATRRMSESFRDVPHFPLTIDIELDALLAVLARINERLERDGATVGLQDMIIKAVAVALRRSPGANASYTPAGIALHHHADIAVGIVGSDGLIAPVIRDVGAKGLAEIAGALKDFEGRAASGDLRADELLGATFSVTNLGAFGIGAFSAILDAPHACGLSVGVAERRAVVRDNAIRTAEMITVTLTCDHRAVDGVIGASFLGVLRTVLQDPLAMLI